MESIALRKSELNEKRRAAGARVDRGALRRCCGIPVGFWPLSLLLNQCFHLKVHVAAVTKWGGGAEGDGCEGEEGSAG